MEKEDKLKKYEEYAKVELKSFIDEQISFCKAIQDEITTIEEILDFEELVPGNLDKLYFIFNNKFGELYRFFKDKNLSMYATVYKYENKDDEIIQTPFIALAIENDIIILFKAALSKLIEYGNCIKNISDTFNKYLESGILVKSFRILKGLLKDELPFYFTEEEEETIKTLYNEARVLIDALWEYDIEKNIVSSIINLRYSTFDQKENLIPLNSYKELVEKNVKTDLAKMGLEHLIPELDKKLLELSVEEQNKVLSRK